MQSGYSFPPTFHLFMPFLRHPASSIPVVVAFGPPQSSHLLLSWASTTMISSLFSAALTLSNENSAWSKSSCIECFGGSASGSPGSRQRPRRR